MNNHYKLSEIIASLTQWSLVSLFLFPVLPEWRINVLFIVFCGLVLISYAFNRKVNPWQYIRRNFIISIPFIPYIIEFAIHPSPTGVGTAGFELEKKLLFFIAPVVLGVYSSILKWKEIRVYMLAFTFALFVVTAYGIAVLLQHNLLFSEEGYDNGARLLRKCFENASDIHPTYYGLFATVAILWLVYDYQNQQTKWKAAYIILGSVLLFTELMLAPKMPLIALPVSLVYLLYKINKNKLKLLYKYALLIAFCVAVPFAIPPVKNRLLDTKAMFASGDKDERLIILDCGTEIFTKNIWLGIGSRNNQPALNECYSEKGFAAAKKETFNAHNQFITLGMNYGIIIVLLFTAGIIYFIRVNRNNPFALVLMASTVMVMLSESVLERQWGDYFYVLFFILFCSIERLKPKAQMQ